MLELHVLSPLKSPILVNPLRQIKVRGEKIHEIILEGCRGKNVNRRRVL